MIAIEKTHPFYQTSPCRYMVVPCKYMVVVCKFSAKKCGEMVDGRLLCFKGTGFQQPQKGHQHWHIDIA